ncbi:MAG: hypothetical protein EBS11_00400 [Janthinobacterium sp.]|nr:hypothetical protein [Janthinobacterium sp.]
MVGHQLFEGRINTVLGLRFQLSGRGKLLFWRDTVRCHVAPAVMAKLPPASKVPDLAERAKQMTGQSIVANCAAIARIGRRSAAALIG